MIKELLHDYGLDENDVTLINAINKRQGCDGREIQKVTGLKQRDFNRSVTNTSELGYVAIRKKGHIDRLHLTRKGIEARADIIADTSNETETETTTKTTAPREVLSLNVPKEPDPNQILADLLEICEFIETGRQLTEIEPELWPLLVVMYGYNSAVTPKQITDQLGEDSVFTLKRVTEICNSNHPALTVRGVQPFKVGLSLAGSNAVKMLIDDLNNRSE